MPGIHRSDSAMDTSGPLSHEESSHSQTGSLDLKVLGVSGDSGLTKSDCVLVHYRQENADAPLCVEVIKSDEVPLSASVRIPILNSLRETQTRSSAIPQSNALVGRMFSATIKAFCAKYSIDLASIDLAGLRVQTIGRLSVPFPRGAPSPFRLWHRIVAEETGITTTVDFHILEQRSPASPISPITFVNRLLLQHPTRFRVCLRIDELANLSFIPPKNDSHDNSTISRDCGPGNLLIDYAMRYCTSNDHRDDNNGEFAAQGAVNQDLVDRFLQSQDYLRNPLPITIATEMFGDHDAQRLIDECIFLRMTEVEAIATITRITAQNILLQYHRLVVHHFSSTQKIDELFICGPGAQNSNIVDFLESELPETVITKPLDDVGIPGAMNTAYCNAYLALEAVLRHSSNAPVQPSTGSEQSTTEAIVGSIATGSRWKEITAHIRLFSDGQPLSIAKRFKIAGDLEAGLNALHMTG